MPYSHAETACPLTDISKEVHGEQVLRKETHVLRVEAFSALITAGS